MRLTNCFCMFINLWLLIISGAYKIQQTPECMLLIIATIAFGPRIVVFAHIFRGHAADNEPV